MKNNKPNNNNINFNFQQTLKSTCRSQFPMLPLLLIGTTLMQLVPTAQPFVMSNLRGPLKVAAFNIQHFGRSVVQDSNIMSSVIKIFDRYDVVLVQEIRDNSNTALDGLKNALEKAGTVWNYVHSETLGRNKYYREQYAFFYREFVAYPVETYQVNDTANDKFEREPFAVEFLFESNKNNKMERVVLMALHTRPKHAKAELIELPTTIKHVATEFPRATGVIALGDFNADCVYLAGKYRKSLKLFNSEEFKSLIGDDVDTAVKKTQNCAYDRAIVYGKDLDVRDAGVYDFQLAFGLTEKEALSVSDHFPIHFDIY